MPDFNSFRAKEEVILVIGQLGSDGGYSVLTPHGVVHVPGNNPEAREAFETLKKSYVQLQEAAARQVSTAVEPDASNATEGVSDDMSTERPEAGQQ